MKYSKIVEALDKILYMIVKQLHRVSYGCKRLHLVKSTKWNWNIIAYDIGISVDNWNIHKKGKSLEGGCVYAYVPSCM